MTWITRLYALVVAIFCITLLSSCSKHSNEVTEGANISSEIDSYIKDVMHVDEIPGLAVVVMRRGALVHKKYYGLANIEHKVPVSDSTIFRIYSTSKLMTCVGIFQLIEQGLLQLEDPISLYIDHVPEAWQSIKVKHLLTHSSGLPDYKDIPHHEALPYEEVWAHLTRANLRFEQGQYYEYNQTGYWFLSQIVEKITGETFDEYILGNQFSHPGSTAFFASNSLTAYDNRVSKYIYNWKDQRYEASTFAAGQKSIAGNGLNVSLNDLIKWNQLLDADSLLGTNAKASMLRPFIYEKDKKVDFLHGWDQFEINGHKSYGFSGGGVSDFKKFDNGLTIIILSNGYKYRPRMAKMMTYIAGIADPALNDLESNIAEKIRVAFLKHPVKDAATIYKKAKKEYPDISFEATLNAVGYDLLSINDILKAIQVFEFNIENHSDSWNCFDSMGEAYLLNGNKELAKVNYARSLELNPDNQNAREMLEKIAN